MDNLEGSAVHKKIGLVGGHWTLPNLSGGSSTHLDFLLLEQSWICEGKKDKSYQVL